MNLRYWELAGCLRPPYIDMFLVKKRTIWLRINPIEIFLLEQPDKFKEIFVYQ